MINSHLLFKFKFNKTQKRITKTFGTQILKTIFIYMKHKEFNYNHLIKKKKILMTSPSYPSASPLLPYLRSKIVLI